MSLAKEFRDPPAAYRVAPFWFWNHELDCEELERQILDMKDKGFGGFIMHARHGLLTPYMGEAWMDAVEHAARVAQREKMWAWLYDEDNWPSGTVGMRMAREHPEYRMSHLYVSDEIDLAKGESVDREVAIGDELYCVMSVPLRDGEALRGKQRMLSRRLKKGRLRYTASRTREKVLVVSRGFFRGAFHDGYLDLMSRQACAWFIRETHDRYAARLKGLLGRSVKGIFTDEPGTFYCRHDRAVQFTPELPKRFEKDHNLPFNEALPALFLASGRTTAKVRLAFHETVKAMYVEAFFRPIRHWCEEHKLRSIGHVVTEGEFADQVKQHGDYFATAEAMHYAGVDTLFEATFAVEGMNNNHLACKFASSAEHLLEKERTMAEAFGVAAGWELSLPTLKWLGDFQAAMGINYFMPHAAYYSIAGFRKWECPPDESYHASYWPFYRAFADHLARLSAALAGGQHVAPVALLSPVAAMAAALDPSQDPVWYTRSGNNPQARAVHDTLEQAAEALTRHQLDFDLVNEEILLRGHVTDEDELEILGKRNRPLERYRALVLPHADALSRKTVDRLEQWAEAGLTIVFLDAMPSLSPEAGQDEPLAARVRKLLDLPNVCQAQTADAAFIEEITRRIDPDVAIRDVRDIVYLMKDTEGRRLVFLANTSRERAYERLKVRIRATGAAHLMDTRTGEPRLLTPLAQDDGWTELELDFPPAGSHLVMFAKRRATKVPAPPRMVNVEGSRLQLSDAWQFTAERGNYFPLHRWRLDIRGDADAPNKWSCYHKTYRTEFHAAISPASAVLLADGLFDQKQFVNNITPQPKVSLNGHELSEWREGTHYDRLVPEADVAPFLRQGMNELVVEDTSNYTAGLNLHQALYLAGDFTVAGQGEHQVISIGRSTIHTGSWADQGFPYFSGIGKYEQEFDLPDDLAAGRLFLEFERVAHVVQVFVNGTEAGLLPWPPWSLEVTDRVRPGRNRLTLRVANAMANVFLLRPDPSGLVGKVTLVAKRPME